jgi:competence protein ComFC
LFNTIGRHVNREFMKKPTAVFNKWATDLLQVLYPNFCLVCDTETPHSPGAICPVCESELHYTFYEDYNGATALDQLFWGRVPVKHTYALLHFEASNSTQAILHALKYRDRPDVARHFGRQLGERVRKMTAFSDLDALVPVPLHPKKQFTRGYNQSEVLACGIAEQLKIPVNRELLKRVVFTESQTRKGKTLRWDNMQGRFESSSAGSQKLKHIAIVDDVVTTGSTLETCVRLLQEALPDCRISIISLAVTKG